MSGWNGSGTFSRVYSWIADAAAGIDITASRMDTDTNNITAAGFGNCLTRDGQGSATANLPMNTFRHTGVGNGQAVTDYAALGQVQTDVGVLWATDGGSANAIAATYTPALASLVDGQLCFVRAANTTTTTTPTFAPSGLTAETITKIGGLALAVGDIQANQELILRYNLSNTRWELVNPRGSFNPQVSTTNWVAAGGTADAITATYSPAITVLYDGLLCWFRAGAANATTTPTFAPNGLTAHTVTRAGGSALVAKDIPGNLAEIILRYNLANTRWELLNPAVSTLASLTNLTNSLGSDVVLNNTSNFFDGPSVAQGTSGTWLATGTVVLQDTAGAASFEIKLWDGTTVVASAYFAQATTGNATSMSISGIIASPAGNIRISARDVSSTSGKILFNQSGLSKDSTISVVRIG